MNLPDLLRDLARDFLAYWLNYALVLLFAFVLLILAQPFLWLGFDYQLSAFFSFILTAWLFFRS